VNKRDLEHWLRGFKGDIRIVVATDQGLVPANIRYEIGKHTGHEGVAVVYPRPVR
jgi:hypothetical protein